MKDWLEENFTNLFLLHFYTKTNEFAYVIILELPTYVDVRCEH